MDSKHQLTVSKSIAGSTIKLTDVNLMALHNQPTGLYKIAIKILKAHLIKEVEQLKRYMENQGNNTKLKPTIELIDQFIIAKKYKNKTLQNFNEKLNAQVNSKSHIFFKTTQFDFLIKRVQLLLSKIKKLQSKNKPPLQEINSIISKHLLEKFTDLTQYTNQLVSEMRANRLQTYANKKSLKHTLYAQAKSDAAVEFIQCTDLIKNISYETSSITINGIKTKLIKLKKNFNAAIESKNTHLKFYQRKHYGGKIGMLIRDGIDHLIVQLDYIQKMAHDREAVITHIAKTTLRI